jgi:hypothetical protein
MQYNFLHHMCTAVHNYVEALMQIARAACGKADVADPQCINTLLLLLTPDAYSSNNTADTPGGRAFISPAQVTARTCTSGNLL